MYSLCWTVAGALLVVVSAAACDRATDPGAQVAQVTVSPARAALIAGDTIHLAAVALDAGGRTRDSVRVRWEVSDTAVALIDSTGVVFGRRGGGVSVRASAGQAYGDAALEVRGPPPGWTGFDVVCGIWKDSNAY